MQEVQQTITQHKKWKVVHTEYDHRVDPIL